MFCIESNGINGFGKSLLLKSINNDVQTELKIVSIIAVATLAWFGSNSVSNFDHLI